jgi:DNA helicase-2/ATP-dependent DNA helicase PcrA
MIGLGRERFTKNLWTNRTTTARPQLVSVRDEADQARYIAERVLENREGGLMLKQQGVLFRTSHHCGPLEVELTLRNIRSTSRNTSNPPSEDSRPPSKRATTGLP